MFVEGLINVGLLEVLRLRAREFYPGVSIIWVADTPLKAKRRGYDCYDSYLDEIHFDEQVYVKIALNNELTDLLSIEKAVGDVQIKDLPLLIDNPNPDIVKAVKERLKKEAAPCLLKV